MAHTAGTGSSGLESPVPEKPPKSLMRSLGEFFGNIARGVTADVGKAKPQEVKRTVEEETRETPEGKITLRRTTIEEVEIKKPAEPPRGA